MRVHVWRLQSAYICHFYVVWRLALCSVIYISYLTVPGTSADPEEVIGPGAWENKSRTLKLSAVFAHHPFIFPAPTHLPTPTPKSPNSYLIPLWSTVFRIPSTLSVSMITLVPVSACAFLNFVCRY